ncbi:MAG: hypothetical protein U1F43_14785 [Myxococcota bacterium]
MALVARREVARQVPHIRLQNGREARRPRGRGRLWRRAGGEARHARDHERPERIHHLGCALRRRGWQGARACPPPPRIRRCRMHATRLASCLVVLAACGGGSAPSLPSGLEAEHVAAVGGVSDLAGFLADGAATRAEVRDGAPRPVDVGSADGWAAAGLDVDGGLTLALDDRLADADGGEPLPMLIVRVTDRAKLWAALGQLGFALTVADRGATQALRMGDQTVALFGALGDRTAFVPVTRPDAEADLARRLATVLAGRDTLAGDPTWKSAMKSARGPGLFAFAGPRTFGLLFDRHAHGDGVEGELEKALAGSSVFIGRDGLTVRSVPVAGAEARFEAVYTGNASPPDMGRPVPSKGWAVLRWSLDLDRGVDLAKGLFPIDQMLLDLVGPSGPTVAELRAALTGDVGVAIDVASAFAFAKADAADERSTPHVFGMVGVRDGAAADRLLQRFADAAAAHAGAGPGARAVTVGGHAGWSTTSAEQGVAIVRVDDLIFVGPGLVVAAAIAQAEGSDHFSDSDAGKVLGQRGLVAFGADLAPLVAFVASAQGQHGGDWFANLVAGMLSGMPSWSAFSAHPIVTLHVGWDGDAAVTELREGGLLYGYAASAVAGLGVALPRIIGIGRPPATAPSQP